MTTAVESNLVPPETISSSNRSSGGGGVSLQQQSPTTMTSTTTTISGQNRSPPPATFGVFSSHPPQHKRTKILTSPKPKPPPATVSHEDVNAQQESEWRRQYERVRDYCHRHGGHLPTSATTSTSTTTTLNTPSAAAPPKQKKQQQQEEEEEEAAALRDWLLWQQETWDAQSPTRRLLLLQLGFGITKNTKNITKGKARTTTGGASTPKVLSDNDDDDGDDDDNDEAEVGADGDDDEDGWIPLEVPTTRNNSSSSSRSRRTVPIATASAGAASAAGAAAARDVYEQNWLTRFRELEAFYDKFGHFRINKDDEQYKSLAYWVTRQRRRRAGKPNCGRPLTQDQIDMLDAVGFPWIVPSGRGHVGGSGGALDRDRGEDEGRIAARRSSRSSHRFHHYSSEDEDDERRSLSKNDNDNDNDEEGVVDWDDPYERKWLESYRDLKRYYRVHGTFSFPEKDPKYKPLAYWVTRQRRLKLGKLRGQTLLKHREKLLRRIGFPWVPERMRTNNSNSTAVTGKQQHNGSDDSDNDTMDDDDDDESLVQDNVSNRDEEEEEDGGEYDSGDNAGASQRLTAPRFERLWMDRFRQLRAFHRKHGHFTVPKQDPKYKSLAYWIVSQRRRKAGKRNCGKPLPQHHVQLLDEIGFPWDGHEARRQWNGIGAAGGGEGVEDDDHDDDNDDMEDEESLEQEDNDEQSTRDIDDDEDDGSDTVRRARTRRRHSSLGRRSRSRSESNNSAAANKNAYEERWMAKYRDLQDFYRRHGHYCVEKGGKRYKSLAYWVIRQRELRNGKRKGESLLQHREELLNQIHFPWDGHQARRELIDGKDHPSMSSDEGSADEDDDDDSSVVRLQGRRRSRNDNHDNTAQLSGSEASSLDGENAYEKRWLIKYRELKRFFKKHGHYCIAESDPGYRSLAYWVHRQRELRNGKRRGENFPKHREELLDQIGFQWDGREARREKEQMDAGQATMPKRNGLSGSASVDSASSGGSNSNSSSPDRHLAYRLEQQWMERYHELKDYVKTYGNFSISKTDREHQTLANWMARQRQLRWGKKRGGLPSHRIELLDKINFPWSCNDEQRKTNVRAQRASAAGAGYGDSDSDDVSDSEGGRNTDSEAEEHLSEAKDGSAGFHDQQWLSKFVELKRFHRKYGHFWCTRWSGEEHRPLSYWVEKQRQFYLNDELPSHRKKMLKDLGFPWDWKEAKQQYLEIAGSDDDDGRDHDDAAISDEDESGSERIGLRKKSSAKKRKRSDKDYDYRTSPKEAKASTAKPHKSKSDNTESDEELMSRIRSSNYGEQWLRQFDSLKHFFSEHGHFIIPHTPEKYRSFYKWVWFQRKRLTQKDIKNPLVAAKVELLNRINFDWEGA